MKADAAARRAERSAEFGTRKCGSCENEITWGGVGVQPVYCSPTCQRRKLQGEYKRRVTAAKYSGTTTCAWCATTFQSAPKKVHCSPVCAKAFNQSQTPGSTMPVRAEAFTDRINDAGFEVVDVAEGPFTSTSRVVFVPMAGGDAKVMMAGRALIEALPKPEPLPVKYGTSRSDFHALVARLGLEPVGPLPANKLGNIPSDAQVLVRIKGGTHALPVRIDKLRNGAHPFRNPEASKLMIPLDQFDRPIPPPPAYNS
jgi:hypothetical protein